MKGFLVGGTASGVGKTTVMLAILAAMRRRGKTVQAFKGGPDFLDTGHHTRISGRPARNLDTWMLPVEANRQVLAEASRDADMAIVEGMMGLYDGKSGDSETGSSAEIAKLLNLPVVLVLDAGKTARSIAAVVLGFELFDPQITIAGVIFNRCASARHFAMLQTAVLASCKTPVLGWMPRDHAMGIPERHLGLQTVEEAAEGELTTEELIDALAGLAEAHLNLDAMMALKCGADTPLAETAILRATNDIRIGVARDRAFSFYYEDNLDLLRQEGATLVPFSPLVDAALPPDLDALYLGGGYPELYAEQLSRNLSMLRSIKAFADSDRPVYAECGGMIYLAQTLTTTDGVSHAFVGVLPLDMAMTKKLSRFGYVEVELEQDCLLGARGTTMRGHSFHYSQITNQPEIKKNYLVRYSLSKQQEEEGYSIGNTLASYVHLHFRAMPSAARHFIEAAQAVQSKRAVLQCQ